MSDDLHYLSIDEARARLDRRELSSIELTEAHLRRIEAVEDSVKAFITLTPEAALEQARLADDRIKAGDVHTFTGIPVALKDVLCTHDAPTTAASQILREFVPPYDATAVARLRAQGAIFVGKANTDEFAMGSSTENSGFHTTHNPWDLARVPGGSSGGPIAAVAAGEALVGLGSETGGSVRQPAGFCGIVGLKTTYGRISRYGLIAFASSLDQIGPAARSVADCAHTLRAIAGQDPRDATSAPAPVPDYRAALTGDIRGLRVGVPREYFEQGLQPGVERAVRAALAQLEALGARLVEISLPTSKVALPVYYIIAPAEASANLARYDGIKYGLSVMEDSLLATYLASRRAGFGQEVKRRIMIGTYALSSGYYDAYYVKAQQVRTLIKDEFDCVFGLAGDQRDVVDVIAAPTSPTTAFKIGERSADPLAMYLSDILTIPANLAGIPSVAVPCGFDGDDGQRGLPVSLQIMGPAFSEDLILRVADAYERSATWATRRPPLDAAPVGA
ncbi:MAG TPA: Asp-tRNA(Asn)/Glu-tRNA(Gln) amidotransferase subunit GatA [Thermomicrobiales bacterium]|nr:Asp-tRNA(Asn)/Glu-tRNA(Gln) amidotransferase subunit GatA [Thermomicrobiales bacterium]